MLTGYAKWGGEYATRYAKSTGGHVKGYATWGGENVKGYVQWVVMIRDFLHEMEDILRVLINEIGIC